MRDVPLCESRFIVLHFMRDILLSLYVLWMAALAVVCARYHARCPAAPPPWRRIHERTTAYWAGLPAARLRAAEAG